MDFSPRRSPLAVSALLGLLLGACGEEPAPGIVGTWVADTGDGCELGLKLEDDHRYARALACPLESGAVGSQIDRGEYDTFGDRITFTAVESSCPAGVRDGTFAHELRGEQLTLRGSNGAIVYQRVYPRGDGSGIVKYGCFYADDTFETRDVEQL